MLTLTALDVTITNSLINYFKHDNDLHKKKTFFFVEATLSNIDTTLLTHDRVSAVGSFRGK